MSLSDLVKAQKTIDGEWKEIDITSQINQIVTEIDIELYDNKNHMYKLYLSKFNVRSGGSSKGNILNLDGSKHQEGRVKVRCSGSDKLIPIIFTDGGVLCKPYIADINTSSKDERAIKKTLPFIGSNLELIVIIMYLMTKVDTRSNIYISQLQNSDDKGECPVGKRIDEVITDAGLEWDDSWNEMYGPLKSK